MKIRCFLLLTVLLGNIFAFQAHSQVKEQKSKSQTNQKDAVLTDKSTPLKLRLNDGKAGTTADTSILSEKLENIFKDREKEGIFRDGTNEVESSVYLEADRLVPAEEIAKLFGVLNRSGVSPVLIPVPVKDEVPIRPNPLILVVYAGSGQFRTLGAKIEIGFVGELSENSGSAPTDKSQVLVTASKNGVYTMDGKQISAQDLKTAIEKRLKTKAENKVIFVQAENYGNMEDAAAIADSAGARKVFFITKNIRHRENGITFSLSPAFVKDNENEEMEKFYSVAFTGPDNSSFDITFNDELFDKEQAEAETKNEYEARKELISQAEVSRTEIDGSSGILTIQNDEVSYYANWFGFRKKNGKQQPVFISFFCQRAESGYCNSEFLQILNSVKFN
jgi:biopolymer transport protein ExbD